jgi:hypothetical protein
MHVLNRVTCGALAAFCAAGVAADIEIGAKADYPLWHLWFGQNWAAAHNGSIGLLTIGAATFGFLALNVNGAKDKS